MASRFTGEVNSIIYYPSKVVERTVSVCIERFRHRHRELSKANWVWRNAARSHAHAWRVTSLGRGELCAQVIELYITVESLLRDVRVTFMVLYVVRQCCSSPL